MRIIRNIRDFDEEEDYEDNTIYSKSKREDLIENDEISPIEEGFMEGYEQGVQS